MATILIVEDRPLDRQLLTAVLRTRGHQIMEATDGQEALDTLPQIVPDVVISDILMPTADGCEFVRRMREIPALATTPVIFRAATYHEQEARALAHQCGVFDVLTTPGAPHEILATVDAALGRKERSPGARLPRMDVDRDRRAAASARTRRETETDRMNTILDVAEQLAGEPNPIVLLDKVCSEARHATLAQHAVVGLLSEEGSAGRVLHISGLDAAAKARLTPRSVGGGLLTTVLQERRPVRAQNPRGRPEALGLPAEHPALSSVLSVPIASSSRVYGWITLGNKLGTDEFSEVDECMASTLGALAGIAYEKAHLFHDLHRRLTALEHELRQTSARVREEERAQLSRTLHDQMGQTLVALKFDVDWVATQIASLTGGSDTVTRRLDSMLARVDDAMKSVRATASELRPAVLDKLGLVAAIEWQAGEFERRSGIRCPVDSRIVESDLEPHWATAIFRIVQEALTNVMVHAHATRASVKIQRSVGSLTVSISDNGRGISDRDLANGGSLGLLGMRERAAELGGRVTVRRRKPAGTLVTVTVPFTRTGVARG